MAYIKRLVCLANSKRPNGRCIAGRTLAGRAIGEWIRPVSGEGSESIPFQQQVCSDGVGTELLDILDINLQSPNPQSHQSENHIVTGGEWARAGRFPFARLVDIAEAQPDILEAVGDSTYYGVNDRVDGAVAGRYQNSLALIAIADPEVSVSMEGQEFDNPRKRIKVRFDFSGHRYSIHCTDPYIWEHYRRREEGDYPLGEAYLTVSLTQPHIDGKCYRIAAAVFTQDRA